MLQSIDVAIREALKDVGFDETPRQVRVAYDPNESRSSSDAFLVYGITVDQQLDQSALVKALGKDEFFTELTKFADARLRNATGDQNLSIPFKERGLISVANSNGREQCLLYCGDLIAGVFQPPPSGKELVVGYLSVPGGAAVLKNVSASVGPADTLEFVAVAIREALQDVNFTEVLRQVRVFYDPDHESSSSRRLLSSSDDAKLIYGITVDEDLNTDALVQALTNDKFYPSLAKYTNQRIASKTNINSNLSFAMEGSVITANSQGRTTCVSNCAAPPKSPKSDKLSGGIIAVIVILCVVVIAVMGLLFWRKRSGPAKATKLSNNTNATFKDPEADLQLVAVTVDANDHLVEENSGEADKDAFSPVIYEQ